MVTLLKGGNHYPPFFFVIQAPHSKDPILVHNKGGTPMKARACLLLAMLLPILASGQRVQDGPRPMGRPEEEKDLTRLSNQAGQISSAPSKRERVEKELMELEEKWSTALVNRDLEFLGRILAEEFVLTDASGAAQNKGDLLNNLKSGEFVVYSSVCDDWKIRIYGDMAVVIARETSRAQHLGLDVSGQYRFTDVFVKRTGMWQCVATQSTLVAKK
jgi:ketosteroid isomerase-like protein